MDAGNLAIEIFNSIADGKDGTLSRSGQGLPGEGYFVGGVGKPLVFDSSRHANASAALELIFEFVDAQSAPYIGWWTDSADGKVYIDGTSWFEHADQAGRVAFQSHEIAFWDIAGGREWRFTYAPTEA